MAENVDKPHAVNRTLTRSKPTPTCIKATTRKVSFDRSAAAFVLAYLTVFLFALLAARQQADEL